MLYFFIIILCFDFSIQSNGSCGQFNNNNSGDKKRREENHIRKIGSTTTTTKKKVQCSQPKRINENPRLLLLFRLDIYLVWLVHINPTTTTTKMNE